MFNAPVEMLSFHFLLLIGLIFTMANWYWRIYFAIVSMMCIADTVWRFMPNLQPMFENYLPEMEYAFPYDIFWWQSLLIVLFLALCIVTVSMNYLIHQRNKLTKELEHANIWAYIGNFIEVAKTSYRVKILAQGDHKRH